MVTNTEKATLDVVAGVVSAYDTVPRGAETCEAFGRTLGVLLTPIRKDNYPLYQLAANRLMARLSYEATNALLGVEYSDAPKAPGATYRHDCDKCQFLGRLLDGDLRPFDAYMCETGATGVALVARYGHAGEDYRSISMAYAKCFPETLWNEVLKLVQARAA